MFGRPVHGARSEGRPERGLRERCRRAASLLAASLALVAPRASSAEDIGHVAVLRHDGSSYARNLPDGSFNVSPRQAAARQEPELGRSATAPRARR